MLSKLCGWFIYTYLIHNTVSTEYLQKQASNVTVHVCMTPWASIRHCACVHDAHVPGSHAQRCVLAMGPWESCTMTMVL